MERVFLGIERGNRMPVRPTSQSDTGRDIEDRRILVGFVQWPDGLSAEDSAWASLADEILDSNVDLLVTNELPFGRWPTAPAYDEAAAQECMRAHRAGIAALSSLGLRAVISSRPVARSGRLANEAIVIEDGVVRPVRHKRYLLDEPGWRERSWFAPGPEDFTLVETCGLRVGILLGTELMFTERARLLGRQGADLIAVPRSSGPSPMWATAGAMAAISSGAYLVSSNRSGGSLLDVAFGGHSFAYSPGGNLIARTSDEEWLRTVAIDVGRVRRQKSRYPCYVEEPGGA